jgi:alpha-tubulin suppressor-like RCC1 family protein
VTPATPTDGGAVRIPVPDRVQGRAITAISFGTFHDVVLTTGGFVDVWMAKGAANLHGLETIPSSLTAGGVKAVAAGYAHILALTAAGGVVAWGLDLDSQATVPPVVSDGGVKMIAAAFNSSLAVTNVGGGCLRRSWSSSCPAAGSIGSPYCDGF